MDDADLTQLREETQQALIAKYKPATKMEAEATGECLWCEAVISYNRRWCDTYCRDSWDCRSTASKKLGR
jgi:hypothetical protein